MRQHLDIGLQQPAMSVLVALGSESKHSIVNDPFEHELIS